MDLRPALEHSTKVEAFQHKHRTGLLTLLFTDIVGSGKIKQALGDQAGVTSLQQHHAMVREILSQFPGRQVKGYVKAGGAGAEQWRARFFS
ncbi:MAG: hypothetical protein HYY23_12950 [Verrucomicrobia bacterium]|nr:hypothetical protein [Verrucomicrobiota bacterium]